MFDLGWSELLIIGIVALIVVGPKDLPVMFRTLGRFMGKARSMAREFTSAMNEAADEAGVKDLKKDLNSIANPKSMGMNKLKDAADAFEKWDPMAEADASDAASQKVEGAETAALREKREAEAAQRKADAVARAEARMAPAEQPAAAPAEEAPKA
ncbi:MAG: Sec-independent protein translocase protein TatB [Pseudomonadota bacterium]